MKWWNVHSGEGIDIYKIYSDGKLLKNSGVEGDCYLNAGEVGMALSLDGEAAYQKLKQLFESKYPQREQEKKPLPEKERLGLEERFF